MRPPSRPIMAVAALLVTAAAGCALRSGRGAARPASRQPSAPAVSALVKPGGETAFVGSKPCRSCHAKEFEQHRTSAHAHTAGPVPSAALTAAFRMRQTLYDPDSGVTYAFGIEGGKPVCTARHPSIPGPYSMTPAYAFGSGKIGQTMLFLQEGQVIEGRASYYPGARKWAWTPGQRSGMGDHPLGRTLSHERAVACFLCHSTVLVDDGRRLLPEKSRLNVGCERCHGPGAAHVAAARQGRDGGNILGYRSPRAEEITRLCGECHSAPAEVPEQALEHIPSAPRFAGTNLVASRCYKQSRGRLSCLSCHDPHTPASRDLPSYDRACVRCHTETGDGLCKAGKTSGCVSCHMPLKEVPFPIERKFRTHLIKVYRTPLP